MMFFFAKTWPFWLLAALLAALIAWLLCRWWSRRHPAARTAHTARPDDLTLVDGIGPKIEQLCHQAGIRTYAQLADTPVEQLQAILDAAGQRFAVHDPASWPAKAAALARGERPPAQR